MTQVQLSIKEVKKAVRYSKNIETFYSTIMVQNIVCPLVVRDTI